ncbi:MAG: Trm112 family protein, partial [Planctomycetota bacterium]
MAIDQELLDILVCPETHQPLKLADEETLADLNGKIKASALKNH